jgi:ABC-type dipeptide/oligopeptide/nickel transport system permease subunit
MFILKKLWNQNKFKISFLIIIFLFLLAVLSYWITPYSPDAMNLLSLEEPPSLMHIFGTDDLGRDVFSRVLAGTRITLSVERKLRS